MKPFVLIPLLVLSVVLVPVLGAQIASPAVEQKRTFQQFGASYAKGNDSSWSEPGFGVTARSFSFFDKDSPEGGLYYGFGVGVGHAIGGVSIVDTRLITLGWMGNPMVWFGRPGGGFDLDLALSPTLGTRIQNRQIVGEFYAGLGLTVGLSLPLNLPLIGEGGLGLSWEPVIPLAALGDSAPVPNRGYMDFVLSWTVKLNTETRSLPWRPRS